MSYESVKKQLERSFSWDSKKSDNYNKENQKLAASFGVNASGVAAHERARLTQRRTEASPTSAIDQYVAQMNANAQQATDAYEESKNNLTKSWWEVLGNAVQSGWNATLGIQPSLEDAQRNAQAGERLSAAIQSKDERGQLFREMTEANSAAQEARTYQQYVTGVNKYGSSEALFQSYADRIKEIEDEYRTQPAMWREAREQVNALEQERDNLQNYEAQLKKGQENAEVLDAWAKGNGGTYESYQRAQQNYDELDRRVTQLQNELTAAGAAEVDYSGWATDEMTAAAIAASPAPKTSSKEIQAQLEQAIRERDKAKLILQYAQEHQADELNKAPDFELKAAAGEEKFKAFKQEQQQELNTIETNPFAPSTVSRYDPTYHSDYREPDERWSEEEKKNFYYLYATDQQQAYDYGISIDQKYNRGEAEDRDWQTREFATRNFGTGTLASAGSVPANLIGGAIDYGRMFAENSARGGVYETQYDGWSRWAETSRGAIAEKLNESGTISSDVPVLGGKGLGDLYQLMMSMADSSVAVMAGGGAANAVFFGSAAASTTRQALERGISGNRAVAMGFAAGAAEVAGETLSVEHLLKQGDIADYLRHGLLREMAKQGGVEASEEVLTSIMNMIADAVINGDQAELQQKVYVNVANGMAYDEAVRQASKEWLEELGTDALGGFLSGGLMSGGRLAIESGVAAVTKYQGDAKGDLELARLTTEGSRSRSLAEQYQQRLDKKGSLTNLQAARLQAQTSADISAADRPALLKAAEERLRDQSTSKRYSDEYKRMAEGIVDRVMEGGKGKFSTALEQNVYEEMQMQLGGVSVPTGNWLDTNILKKTQAQEIATERLRSVETKDGSRANIKNASMKDGKLQLTIEQNGETKTLSQDELKLDDYQKSALETLTRILGDDAAAAFNQMTTGSSYGRASSITEYATAFATIRDLFGRATDTEKAEKTALASSLRKGLTDTQVRYAIAIGQQRAKENPDSGHRTARGTGKVSFEGGTLNDGTVLKGVKDVETVKRSEQYRAVKAVAKALGIDVVLFESESVDENGSLSGAQGAYQDGVIYLDWNAGMRNTKEVGSRMLLRTMSHELTHFIQENSPGDYADLKAFITKRLTDKVGRSFNDLVMEKLDGQPNLSYDEAVDEVVADSCETMLRDSQAVQDLMQEHKSLWQSIRNFVKKFLQRITAEYEGAILLQDSIDELRQIWDLGLRNAVESRPDAAAVATASKEMKAEVLQRSAEALTEIDPTEETATVTLPDGQQYSIRSMRHDIAEGKMFEDLVRYTDMSREEVQELRKNLERLTDIIALNRDILDLNESFGKDNRPFKPYKPNSDPLYTISLDFSTLCRKRLMTQYVIERLQTELTDSQTGKRGRPLTAEEQLAVRDLMKEYGQQEKALKVACAMCYVEAARLKAPGQIQRFMRDPTEPMRRYFALRNKDFNASVRNAQADFKEQHGYARDAAKSAMKPADVTALNKLSNQLRNGYQMSAEEQRELEVAKTLPNETYLTAANLAKLAEEHPTIYDAYTATIRSATRSKSLEADIPYYYGDSRGAVSDDFIAAVNRENGMRYSSWSDFQIQHMLDMMTAVIELSVRHCAMHGYTKFLEQVRIFGRTGMMFNMSGVANGTGLKADGSLDFSHTESVLVYGQDGEYDAIQAREDFPETAGLQCIGISTEHIQALLDSDIIDYIIPYHTSGLNATLRRMAQISNWKDFTAFQNAKQDPSIRFDPSIHDRNTWHKEPVFSEFFNAAKQESNGYRAGEKGVVTMRRAAELYKQMCRERGMMPKFSWGNSKVDADFSNDPNYWKLLIDRKMINQKTGALIEQKPVRPDFDFKLIEQMVQEAVDAYDPTLQDRALNYVRDHLDELPQRIADLKKAGAVKKITGRKTSNAAKTLQAGPVAAVSEGNVEGSKKAATKGGKAPQLSVRAGHVEANDSDETRAKILKSKKITAPIYEGQADAHILSNKKDLDSQQADLVKAALQRISEQFEIPAIQYNDDYDIQIRYSKKTISESAHKNIFNATEVAKVLPVLSRSVKGAVGIESHDNRYYYDTDTIAMHELLGGYYEGKHYVPVLFGVKQTKGSGNTLYVIIGSENSKTEVMEPPTTSRPAHDSRSVDISITDIIKNVKDEDILEYLPDPMLDDEQRDLKYKAIADTIKYTADKNDKKYAEYIRKGRMFEVKRMVHAAAKAHGYTIKVYHGTTQGGFTIFRPNKGGIFTTDNRNVAGAYADSMVENNPRSKVYELYARPGKQFVVDAGGSYFTAIPVSAVGADLVNQYPLMRGKRTLLPEEIARIAAREGYDSVRIDNVVDPPSSISVNGQESGTDYIFFKPNDVKSAEPITYDDNGNVIPLSRRFDTSTGDIRYSTRDRQTDTPQFKRWFGNSKVVDEDGNPLVVYHGTEADFTVFDRTKGRSTMDIQGMFFSPWEIEAGGYGSKVGAYYLSIQNPAPEGIAYKALNMFKGQNNAGVKAREYLEARGYDGVQGYDEWIAFRPEQIKSATDNIGTFDRKNPDVRFSMRGTAKTVDPSGIVPVNEVTDRSKYDYLVDSFRKEGYQGRPIVAVGDEGDAVALTGSHRLAAAKEAEIDVPVVFIPHDSSNEYIMALVDAARDEDRTLAAKEAYEAGAISKDVYDLIAREDELNSENYDVPYDRQARFSVRDRQHNNWAPTFYSKMQNVITDWTNGKGQPLPPKMSAQQVVGWLKGKGVKAEEIRWSGIVPWMEGRKTVTRDELLQIMAENQINIETKVLEQGQGERYVGRFDWDDLELDSREETRMAAEEAARQSGLDPERLEESENSVYLYYVSSDTGEIVAQFKKEQDPGGTRWKEYSFPEGENYREVLFKQPSLGGYTNRAMQVHWGEKDVIAHARVQDLTDFLGRRVLFIDEIQSDLHNEGAKSGFESETSSARVERISKAKAKVDSLEGEYTAAMKESSDLAHELLDAWKESGSKDAGKATIATVRAWINGHGRYPTVPRAEEYDLRADQMLDALRAEDRLLGSWFLEPMWDRIVSIRNRVQAYDNAVQEYEVSQKRAANVAPDVPFAGESDTYHEYVMKHLLRMAAEGDYFAIGWTTAQQQVERWSDEFEEGYKIEYDQNLPKFMRKYVKQWGANVSTLQLGKGNPDVWGVRLNDAMKESVLTEGQPLFSMRGGTKTDTQLLRDLYERTVAKEQKRAEKNEAGLVKSYQRELRDKQGVIEELQEKQRKALEKFHELSERYYEKEREVSAALQELDRLVQHSGSREDIQRQRAKVSAKEEQMAKALERLTQAKGGSEIQEILRQEREIQMRRTQERIRDSIDRRELRQRISKLWKDLNQKVTSPSEKKRIPVELMQQTLDVLEAINMDTSREGSKAGEKLRAKLDSLRARYEELKNDPDFRKAAVYDAQVAEYLTNMIAQVGDTPINKMSVAQLETVYSTLQAMVYTANRALKLKLGEQEVEAYEVSRAMTKETRSVEKPRTGFLSTWLNAQLSPERMFNRLGGYSKNSYWSQVFGMLNEGQLKQTRLQMEGSLIFEDLLESKDYQKLLDPKNTVDIGLKDENGEPVLITHGMMISLYMHLQNDQNIRHIAYGGLTIPALKDYYNGKKVRGGERATRVGGALQEIAEINDRLHETEDADEIAELEQQRDEAAIRAMDYVEGLREEIDKQLTDYDRQWIAASKELFDGFSKRELNKTTMEVYGIKRANVENYFPIWVDGDFLNTPFEAVAKDLSLENAGFMKERIDSSKPIRLADVTDVTASQIRKVAQYCGLMPAIRGFNKVWGKSQTGYRDSLQKAVHETFGQAGVKYVENLMADLNGARGGQDSALGEFLNRMRGHMAQASLTLSLRTAMGQTASYPTAAAVVGWGPLMKALAHGGRNNTIISRADQELIRKWSPLLYYRMKGYSTTELGDIAGMNDKFSRLWKKARWLTGWIQAMDGATVGRLWYAAEYYVQDHNKALAKGTDAYYEAVAKVFNDIVEKTQPDYTTLQRPDILRNPNALVKQLTMFLTQRLQNFNILYDAAATYSKYKADYKAGRGDVTAEDVRQAGIATRRAVVSQIAAAATITAFKFLADVILHSMNNYRDDDDELTKQSVSLELLDMFMDSLAGNVLGGGEVYDLIESKVFGKTYYGIEVSGLATVTDLVGAFSSAFDHAVKGTLSKKDVDKLARNISTVAGIPYANGKKIVTGLFHHAQDVRNGAFLSFEAGVERSNAQQASRLYRAYTEGDGAKVKQILEEVPEDKQKDVYSAVRKLIKEQQKSGELNVYEAMRQMKNYGGATDQIMADYIKELYEAGALPKADAEKYLQEYAGKTKEAAAKTVTNVDGKQASGVNYNDIDDMFKIGKMSADEARKALVNYGIAQDTANMKVEYWSYQQKNPGTAMTTEDRFETYWKKYRPVGMTPSMYDDFYVAWNAVQGTDKNHDGKADANSKKYERIAIIDSLPLSREQKDALFNMEWKTGLQDAPWNK